MRFESKPVPTKYIQYIYLYKVEKGVPSSAPTFTAFLFILCMLPTTQQKHVYSCVCNFALSGTQNVIHNL